MKTTIIDTKNKIDNKITFIINSIKEIKKEKSIRKLSLDEQIERINQASNNLLNSLKMIDDLIIELDDLDSQQRIEKLRIIRHDLRSPINGIQGYSEMILDTLHENDEPTLISEFQSILSVCKNLLNCIDEINSNKEDMSSDTNHLKNNLEEIRPGKLQIIHNNYLILVVDDIELNRHLLKDWLSAKGYHILTASNGYEAIDILKSHSVDVVLLDMIMPQMNGFEFLEYIKTDKNFLDLSVIIISALNDMDKIARCIQMGAEDYLIKPFNSFLLEARIKACTEKKILRTQEKSYISSLIEEKNYTNSLINSMNNMLIVTDNNLIVQNINSSVTGILGNHKNLIGKSLDTIFANHNVYKNLKENIFNISQRRNLEIDFKISKGIFIPVLLSYTHLLDIKEELKNIIFVAQDIFEIKNAQDQLKKAYSLIKTTIESTKEGIITVDSNLNILEYNIIFLEMWNIRSKKLENQNFKTLMYDIVGQVKNLKSVMMSIKNVLNSKDKMTDIWHLHDDKVIEVYSQPQLLEEDTIGRIFCFRDITEHHKLERQLFYQANHDSLTGLHNRGFLTSEIQEYFSYVQKKNLLLGIIILDVDHFKTINDTLGHDIGDLLLQNISERLRECVRNHNVITRFGGDEFVIGVTGKDQQKISKLIKIIQKSFEKPFLIKNHTLNITASLGVSLYPKDGLELTHLLKKADLALYSVKEKGRNSYQFYDDSIEKNSLTQHQIEYDLKNINFDKEFELRYQPIIDIKENSIYAVEVLLRWRHPQYGLLLPDRFLPITKKMDLSKSIDEWVLNKACLQRAKWTHSGLPDFKIMINISSFHSKNYIFFEKILENTINETGVNPCLIGLELTEDHLISNNTFLIKTLHSLKNLGLTILIDDFGIGYSNLNYITNFPIDIIKIDKMFFQHITNDLKNKTIVNSIAQMANILNIEVIAEGIENYKQLNHLKKYHKNQIKLIQGYFLHKPLTDMELEQLIISDSSSSRTSG